MKTKLILIALLYSFTGMAMAGDNAAAVAKYTSGNENQVPWRTTDDGTGHQVLHTIVDSGVAGDATAALAVQAPPGATPSPSPARLVGVQGGVPGTDIPVTVRPNGTPFPITATTPIPATTAQKQLTGTPSTFTPATADATVFTLAAGEIGFIQNLSADAPLAVKKGASASTTSFSFILAAGAATDDGKGGAVRIDDWVGAVSVAKMTGTARYIAWKVAP